MLARGRTRSPTQSVRTSPSAADAPSAMARASRGSSSISSCVRGARDGEGAVVSPTSREGYISALSLFHRDGRGRAFLAAANRSARDDRLSPTDSLRSRLSNACFRSSHVRALAARRAVRARRRWISRTNADQPITWLLAFPEIGHPTALRPAYGPSRCQVESIWQKRRGRPDYWRLARRDFFHIEAVGRSRSDNVAGRCFARSSRHALARWRVSTTTSRRSPRSRRAASRYSRSRSWARSRCGSWLARARSTPSSTTSSYLAFGAPISRPWCDGRARDGRASERARRSRGKRHDTVVHVVDARAHGGRAASDGRREDASRAGGEGGFGFGVGDEDGDEDGDGDGWREDPARGLNPLHDGRETHRTRFEPRITATRDATRDRSFASDSSAKVATTSTPTRPRQSTWSRSVYADAGTFPAASATAASISASVFTRAGSIPGAMSCFGARSGRRLDATRSPVATPVRGKTRERHGAHELVVSRANRLGVHDRGVCGVCRGVDGVGRRGKTDPFGVGEENGFVLADAESIHLADARGSGGRGEVGDVVAAVYARVHSRETFLRASRGT